ncbi:hypothetical protein PAT3040_05609 [Paenibacillus agaridevorans]|uniref:RNA polymerase sigma factor n=1 Tax=Paenibacillus agaridevorans TaxID=171404 RepID=A0A2R5F419_9BACL|nr:sigma-70 family RNA polymerase sigma factor [Paenibacillus agaridevorans]GBG10841.1 hypothetical protein PAT3040_05609 [Paenibacillus agaridevorans]
MSDLSEHYLRYLAPGYDRTEVLEELMGTYGEEVWRFAYFMTRRRDAADDIAQETFIAAYDGMYAYRSESSVKSWLFGIARNKSLHYLRSAFFRKVRAMDNYSLNRSLSGETSSAEQVVMDRMEAGAVWAKVLKLKRKHREVLVMAYHYEMSMAEIAAVLGVAEGTVKSRLSRAKQSMSKLLDVSRDEGEIG